jgi:hypothetical protein
MIRGVLFELFLFLLPFLLFGLYWQLMTDSGTAKESVVYPRIALSVAGLILVAGSLLWWAISGANPRESIYVPPHLENGEVVPGQFERAPDQ